VTDELDRARASLESRLRDVGQHLDIPTPPPDLANEVLRRLESPAPPNRTRHAQRLLAAAAAVAVFATSVTVASVPSARKAVAGWFDFRGVDIEQAPTPSSTGPTTPPTPPPDQPHLGLGQRTTLESVRSTTGFRIALPSGAGRPHFVYEQHDRGATVISLVYRPSKQLPMSGVSSAGLIITEIHTDGQTLLRKILETGASTTAVRVNGHLGVYIAGPQEVIMVLGSRHHTGDNQPILEAPPRLSANSLIWQVDDVTYRLEGAFSERRAVEIARTITP
jgi:hypothetical protein